MARFDSQAGDRSDRLAQLDYAVKNFLFLADQRLKTFNFYILVVVASGGASLKLANTSDRAQLLVVGAFHIVVPLLFWLLERRNLALLNICRSAIVSLENALDWPKASRIAMRERLAGQRLISFRIVIVCVFTMQIIAGATILFHLYLTS